MLRNKNDVRVRRALAHALDLKQFGTDLGSHVLISPPSWLPGGI